VPSSVEGSLVNKESTNEEKEEEDLGCGNVTEGVRTNLHGTGPPTCSYALNRQSGLRPGLIGYFSHAYLAQLFLIMAAMDDLIENTWAQALQLSSEGLR
jgi:hypothetical protein